MVLWLTYSSFSDQFLLAALALSLLVSSKWVVQLICGNVRSPRWMESVFLATAIVALGVVVIDLLRWIDGQPLAALAPFPSLLVVSFAMLAAWLHLRGATWRLSASDIRRKPAAWGVLAVSIGTALFASHRFQISMEPVSSVPEVLDRNAKLQWEPRFVGLTDAGREIPLFRSAATPISAEDGYQRGDQRGNRLLNTVILRSDPDTSSNCHGWVFTSGRFLLDFEGIRTILEDNGYQLCDKPQAGDLIVYYLSPGLIAHTGIVSGVLIDGTVIVESKWGIEGRFLHQPEDQPYSQTFVYYRSPRQGHEIAIFEVADPSSLAKQRSPRKRIRRA